MNMAIDKQVNATLAETLQTQKAAFLANPYPSYASRKSKLEALKQAIIDHQQDIVDALKQDYGHRSASDTRISDILPSINNINYTLKNLKKWMKPSKRHAGLLLSPSKVAVQFQPLGVVGIIVPWNFPITLSIGPLATAIAAGNRAMIKMSEFTPALNKVLTQVLAKVFEQDEVTVVEGEADVAAQFSSLAFDHLLFTGSTVVGKHVMKAASQNLTPVTLELGGKSPVIIAPDIDMKTAVERLIYGKCLNAGQICVAPDYILCPEDRVAEFTAEYQAKFQSMYPDFAHNDDYTNVINDRQYQRLMNVIEDAVIKGATVTPANGEQHHAGKRKLATQLLTGVTPEMLVMQDEIFGPILPIISYNKLDDAISYIQAHDRPLALYIMSFDKQTQQQILAKTHSGGVCINESIFHVAADDAPFGGIGPSGMGHYHGKEGFLTFSHAKTVLHSGKFNSGVMVHPPYGSKLQNLLMKFFIR
ncbi:coniferyl aldehyde dehydrogenase [Shewanella maritima]|uniref:coniferyl aldehyde dehydrogenase n=1 Tax=Shewanella maritima TaxID=2520507 RepID=UPI003735ADDC